MVARAFRLVSQDTTQPLGLIFSKTGCSTTTPKRMPQSSDTFLIFKAQLHRLHKIPPTSSADSFFQSPITPRQRQRMPQSSYTLFRKPNPQRDGSNAAFFCAVTACGFAAEVVEL